ncbi:LacI family DNA-binding transcriptional regulator [Cohnella sp. JJ-181]|uniref:LacI family DNA-binding transcriptional regulator n=1 Tax=Cohnella rhizoplanae TaxID=2974897 RepID=UPI0022FF9E67|nr:GntR family transcriptional regulator [Cohnella sp. JJ-181]CAI6081206.1 Arabinose metabolism transcriptional repressor [Cohnella sp. JJ-181]
MTQEAPLYRKIISFFLKEIAEVRLRAGDRLPTELEIAEQFGVSRITVIRAMRELEHQKLLYRVKGKGTFVREDLDSRNDASVRHEAMAESGSEPYDRESFGRSSIPLISVIMSDSEHSGQEILLGIEHAARKHGYYVSFHNAMLDPRLERSLLEKLAQDARGIIVYPCAGLNNIDVFSGMTIRRFPYVVIDHPLEGIEAPLFSPDNERGSYEMTRHLIRLGHERIAFIAPGLYLHPSLRQRYKGYCRALIEAGIPVRPEWIESEDWHPDVTPGDLQRETAALLKRWLDGSFRPTALLAGNDILAIHLIKSAQLAGIVVPEELSVAGFDNLAMTEYLEVPLTTVSQPFYEMGKYAADSLIRFIRDGAPIEGKLLETGLVIRASTSVPPER